ncbi:MAG: hypothetical protein ACT443_16345 [Gemmatimonadota bacterium]
MKKLLLFALAMFSACDSPTVPERFLRDVYEFRTSQGLVLRWPVGETVELFVVSRDEAAARTQFLNDAVTHGIRVWNDAAIYGEVTLARASSIADADVVVEYSGTVSPLDLSSCLPSGGLATTTFCLDPGGERLAPYDLRDGTPTNVKFVVTVRTTAATDAAAVRRLVAHELGHVLGIAGHSDTRTHLMFGNPETDEPQQADRFTLQVLYHTEADITP